MANLEPSPRGPVPRLTIGIPTVNRAALVGRAIESALAQTLPSIEIIVSDNGSSDNTPAVIERYAERGVRTFHHGSTMSAARHGEFLINQARGEFFVGLSDDDFLEPEFAAEVLALFDRHPELSFVYTGCAVHYEERQVPAIVGPPIESGPAFLAAHYADQREVSWCACVTRVRDLREIGPQPDGRILGDMFFWTKLALRGPVGCVPKVLSHYILLRSNNDNMSHGTAPASWARESRLLADEVIEGVRRSGADAACVARLESDCRRHIARSTANQFVWTRLRGATQAAAWSWLPGCLPYLSVSPVVLSRAGAAAVLPRQMLRSLLLRGAEKLAAARGNGRSDVAHRRNRRIVAAAGAGVFQRLVQVASTLVLMPLLLRVLGAAKFGIWGAAASLAWFSGLVDIGVGTALVTLVARSVALGKDGEARTHIAGALSFGGALASALLLAAGLASVVAGRHGLGAPFLIAIVGLALNLPLNTANNVWMALQKGYVSGFWELVQTLLTLAGLIAAARLTTDVRVYVAVVYGSLVLANLCCLVHLFIAHRELRPRGLSVPAHAIRHVVGEGILYFILNLAGGLSFSLDNVLALELLGPDASARMTIALRICVAGLGLLLVLAQPLWPAFTEAAETADRRWIRRGLLRGSALLVGAAAAGSCLLLLFGERLLRWWLHADLGIGSTLLWAISVWVVAQAVVRVPNLLLNGLSILRYQIVVVVVATLLAFGLKFALAPSLGVAGILWGTTATVLLVGAPAFFWRIHKWTKCPHPGEARIPEQLVEAEFPRVI